MTGALIILGVTLVAGFILWLFRDRSDRSDRSDSSDLSDRSDESDGACCGLHAVCEKAGPLPDSPLYFDDEELDRFARRDPATYTPDEVEEFREVLYTLLPADVYPWGASLTRREIALPYTLRDEWIMLCDDAK